MTMSSTIQEVVLEFLSDKQAPIAIVAIIFFIIIRFLRES